jgi:hypothetical protein
MDSKRTSESAEKKDQQPAQYRRALIKLYTLQISQLSGNTEEYQVETAKAQAHELRI